MLGDERRSPRAPGDLRRYLYFDYSARGALRWYVKVSAKGRRIAISEEYGTEGFDLAYEAAIATLGGVKRMRRVNPTVKPDQPERRYLHVDVSQWGQVRYYVQLRNKLPKIRIKAGFGTPEFDAEVDTAVAAQIALMATRATTSMRRSSAMSPALLCPRRRRSRVPCDGTGARTSKATIGSAI